MTDESKKKSPLRAIREKCLDCCCGSQREVKICEVRGCALWPFRFGKNPFHAKRNLTEEERVAIAERLHNARTAALGKEEDE